LKQYDKDNIASLKLGKQMLQGTKYDFEVNAAYEEKLEEMKENPLAIYTSPRELRRQFVWDAGDIFTSTLVPGWEAAKIGRNKPITDFVREICDYHFAKDLDEDTYISYLRQRRNTIKKIHKGKNSDK